MRSQNELLAISIKDQSYDTTKLSAAIEAATIGKDAIRFPQLSVRRMPMWALTLSCVLIVAIAVLFYLRGTSGWLNAFPLYWAAAAVPQGERTEKVNGRDLQLAHVSGLAVVSAGDGDRLVLAAASDEKSRWFSNSEFSE